ncbi:tripartite tricarboxylate transporter substrate-binding protein [Paracoccus yeei]|uniref:tripartite tricarboxylate transporter substrate-binding protein n=1 Tax=Paracoccus yeei TaxID=147645 RepID=UPI0036F2A355
MRRRTIRPSQSQWWCRFSSALFWQVTGTSGIHLPYKGGGPAQTDLMGGHADASFQNLGAIANFMRDGKMKLLAIAAEERSPEFPDVPTLKELEIEGIRPPRPTPSSPPRSTAGPRWSRRAKSSPRADP